MRVILINRKNSKAVHVGHKLRSMDEIYTVSLCSGVWQADDKTSIGESEQVTCKRCLKIMATADENGVVTIKKKKR